MARVLEYLLPDAETVTASLSRGRTPPPRRARRCAGGEPSAHDLPAGRLLRPRGPGHRQIHPELGVRPVVTPSPQHGVHHERVRSLSAGRWVGGLAACHQARAQRAAPRVRRVCAGDRRARDAAGLHRQQQHVFQALQLRDGESLLPPGRGEGCSPGCLRPWLRPSTLCASPRAGAFILGGASDSRSCWW